VETRSSWIHHSLVLAKGDSMDLSNLSLSMLLHHGTILWKKIKVTSVLSEEGVPQLKVEVSSLPLTKQDVLEVIEFLQPILREFSKTLGVDGELVLELLPPVDQVPEPKGE